MFSKLSELYNQIKTKENIKNKLDDIDIELLKSEVTELSGYDIDNAAAANSDDYIQFSEALETLIDVSREVGFKVGFYLALEMHEKGEL